jgi:rRNA maturation RNase YbeY
VKRILAAEKKSCSILNIIVADNTYLKNLNKMYLKKTRPTNVISFNMGTVSEVYVSCDKAKTSRDLLFFIIHGILHIIGYDDRTLTQKKRMERKCLEYLENA